MRATGQQDTRQQGKSAKEKERMAQEKIRKMQEELARKKQLVISVPDEITVGELATRMKKTSGEVVKRLAEEYGWSDSVPNLSGKLRRGSLRYSEVLELADVLGYEIIWQKRK